MTDILWNTPVEEPTLTLETSSLMLQRSLRWRFLCLDGGQLIDRRGSEASDGDFCFGTEDSPLIGKDQEPQEVAIRFMH